MGKSLNQSRQLYASGLSLIVVWLVPDNEVSDLDVDLYAVLSNYRNPSSYTKGNDKWT